LTQSAVLQGLRAWARRLKHDSVALWFACRHAGTPWLAKAIAGFVVAYALSPIDLIPDFIPVLGYLDDVLLLPGLIWLAIRLIPEPVMVECRARATQWLAAHGAKPRSRWGLVLVISVWVLALGFSGWWLSTQWG
jgi:uncharacterized membrane protein YkvA (DUF1232 family)